MKSTLSFLTTSVLAFMLPFTTLAQKTAADKMLITPQDLTQLVGEWTGSLTYIDYNSGDPFTMPADLIIEEGKDKYQLVLSNIYPNEPKANNSSKMKISKDGLQINKMSVVSRESNDDGNTVVTAEYNGKDGNDNKAALIHEVYIYGPDLFVMRKEVQYEGTSEWIKRNEYRYSRK